MIEHKLSLSDPLNSYNVAQLQFALTDPKCDNPFVNDLSPSTSPAIIPLQAEIDYHNRRMSSSGTSAGDTDSSSILSRPEKRHLSPPPLSQSPTQAKKLRADNHHHWTLSEDHTPEEDSSLSPRLDSDIINSNNNSNNNGNSKVSLPSIFTTFEDPFRHADLRRSSAPSLSAESTRARPSPYPRRSTNNNNNNNSTSNNNNHASNVQSSLSTYQFPPPSASPPLDDNNNTNNKRPRLSADTQFGLANSYPDQQPSSSSTYSTGISSSSAGTGTTPASSAASFSLSSGFSPLTPDYLSRSHNQHANGVSAHIHYNDENWNSSPASIIRPSSTPAGQLPTSSPVIKYEDSMRHSSFSAAPTGPQMYGGAARISGQQRDRMGSLGGFAGGGGGGMPGGINVSLKQDHEWSFPSASSPHQDFVLPPSGPSSYSSPSGNNNNPGAMGPAPPFISVGSSPSAQRSPLPSLPSLPSQPQSQSPSQQPALALADRPPRKRGKLPKETTDYLKAWLHRHSDHPYPSEDEKKQLCHATGLSMSQVSNWMINARRRILAPAHRAASGPTTTTPFPPSGRTNSLGAGSTGGSLLDPMSRRASMPNDNLQLYHPLTLQNLPNGGHHPHSHHHHQQQHQNAPPPEYIGSTRQLLGMAPAPPRTSSSSYVGGGPGGGLYVPSSAAGGGMGHSHGSFASGTGPMSAPATLPSNSFHGGSGSHHHHQPLYSLSGGGGSRMVGGGHQDGYYADGQS